MKQLLIVNSAKALNATGATPYNLSVLEKGAITFFELGASAALAAAPTKNFGIALGLGSNTPAFVIPEVDVNTLTTTYAQHQAGNAFSAAITIPTPTAGKVYTLVLVKNGAVPHERNTWTATETAVTGETAATLATKLAAYFTRMAATGSLEISASVSTATITITGLNVGEGWTLKAADELSGTTITTTVANKAIGDAAYMKQLASQCAAGKGFTDTYADGPTTIPGYPEAIEENKSYDIFTLRFAVGRDSAKTRDERVYQVVHIAVPSDNASLNTIKTILGQPVLVNEAASSSGTE